MHWLTGEQKEAIRLLAAERHTEETCGFVLHSGEVIGVPNGADNPVDEFSISPSVFAEHEEHIKIIDKHQGPSKERSKS